MTSSAENDAAAEAWDRALVRRTTLDGFTIGRYPTCWRAIHTDRSFRPLLTKEATSEHLPTHAR